MNAGGTGSAGGRRGGLEGGKCFFPGAAEPAGGRRGRTGRRQGWRRRTGSGGFSFSDCFSASGGCGAMDLTWVSCFNGGPMRTSVSRLVLMVADPIGIDVSQLYLLGVENLQFF
jgi:hypothetical protein